MKTVIFTDLDGTLLHPKNHSFTDALPALELIKERGIPLVLCSSKTRSELELLRKRLQNEDPFVSENGGAVFIPAGYFPFLAALPGEEYVVTSFGTPYDEIRKAFTRLREQEFVPVKGFGDMTAEEVAALTGLTKEEAALARQREFSEPFLFVDAVNARFLKAIEKNGLQWTRGRLYCLMGNHDKGEAIRLLKRLFERKHGIMNSIGIGDALNDLPLLQEVDHPVLVQKEDGTYDRAVDLPHLIRAGGIGPEGWNRSVLELVR